MNPYGFIKVAAAVPEVKVADTTLHADVIVRLIEQAEGEGADIILFPELSLTAYSCGDLFLTDTLLRGAEAALCRISEATMGKKLVAVIGLPASDGQRLFNCAAVVQNGSVLGVVPKTHLPDYGEFYESRWFCSGSAADQKDITLCGKKVPFGQMIFDAGQYKFGIEICEDLWAGNPPSATLTRQGADIILNLSASNCVVGKKKYRNMLVESRSYTSHCGYVFVSSGPGESTTDTVYSGHVLAAENGSIILDKQNFTFESCLYYTEVDVERIRADRRRLGTFEGISNSPQMPVVTVASPMVSQRPLVRSISPQPFVPMNENRDERFSEIYDILSMSLAKRIRHTGAKTAVIGISGGLDSTLALLVAAKAMDILKRSRTDILAVTMPGFGTTGRTLQNAKSLMSLLGTTMQEISICDACLQHFKDIGHDPQKTDVTYENTQARERTQILMDLANQSGGLVIGTGDLSELALGWATYAGDHISMYGVNGGVPKTLIRYLVDWVGRDAENSELKAVIDSVLDTPVSPELLPVDEDGKIAQKTEEILGDYILHDFFLYYFVRFGFTPEKIFYLATHAFNGAYNEEEIKRALDVFFKRFFQSQFKRSCLPDGPKIGSVTLSPRADFKMPSDASGNIWLS